MNALRYLPFARRVLRRSGPPVHLTLFVTGACNLRCRHCFHWKEVAAGVAGPSALDVDRLAASCAEMGPLLWVSFGGGEPFLREDLPELARSFGVRGLRHLAIPTNGLVGRTEALTERMLIENPETFLSIGVSIDGPADVHDEIRQVPGGHAKTLAATKRLLAMRERHANLGVGVILTVTAENQAVLADHMEELVDELAPDNVTINLARTDALDPTLLNVDLDRYHEVVERKRKLLGAGRLGYFRIPAARLALARDDAMYEHVEAWARGDRSRHLPCTAASISAVVFENGDVRPCEVLGEEASLGNLGDVEWDLSRLWTTERADEVRRTIRATRCACTWECAQADNVLFRARSWPKLLFGAATS
ncbi:MAG: radical SAM protein [Planctomycetota bacterium]